MEIDLSELDKLSLELDEAVSETTMAPDRPAETELGVTETKVYMVGLGGCGGAIVDEAYRAFKMSRDLANNLLNVLILNTNPSDANKLKYTRHRFLRFGHEYGGSGVGAEWKKAERSISKPETAEMLNTNLGTEIYEARLIFVAAALGGGTGCGSIPVVVRYLKKWISRDGAVSEEDMPPIIAVGVLPFNSDSSRTFFNTICGLGNLIRAKPATILLIDNETIRRRFKNERLEKVVQRVNELAAYTLRMLPVAATSPYTGGAKTIFDPQDLKAILKYSAEEASITVPLYAKFPADLVARKGLRFLLEYALRKGALVEYDQPVYKAAFIVRAPPGAIDLTAIDKAKRELIDPLVPGEDVRYGVAVNRDDRYAEALILLVEPTLPRMEEIMEKGLNYFQRYDRTVFAEGISESEFRSCYNLVSKHSSGGRGERIEISL